MTIVVFELLPLLILLAGRKKYDAWCEWRKPSVAAAQV